MLWSLIAVGGFWFWFIVSCFIFAEFIFVLRESPGWSFLWAVIGMVFITPFTTIKAGALIALGWKVILMAIVAYLLIGVLWSLYRWIVNASKIKRFFNESMEQWTEESRKTTLCPLSKDLKFSAWDVKNKIDFLQSFWYKASNKNGIFYHDNPFHYNFQSGWTYERLSKEVFDKLVPKVRYQKSRITMWIFFWPLSVLAYVLEDLLVDFSKWLTRCASRIMICMNNWVFANIKKELDV